MPAEHLHALLVEDDDAYAAMLQLELSSQGGAAVTLDHVRDLTTAKECLATRHFDAVLLDLELPDSSGLRTFDRLQSAAGETPVVVLTSQDDNGLAVAAVHAGAQDYLVKSRTDAELLGRSVRYACERAALLRSLQESEGRFRALVDQSHEAITLLDEAFVARYNSRAVETVTGYAPGELNGRGWARLVHESDVDRLKQVFEASLSTPGEPLAFEYRFRHKDGSWRFGAAVCVNHLANPAVRAFVVNHRDVTGRRAAEEALRVTEERLRQAQKMEAVGRLAGGIAHDFNNVLTAIFGYTDLILDQLPPGDESRGDVEEIKRAAERAATLTRQLLVFSRRQVLQPRILNLDDVIARARPLLARLIGKAALKITRPESLWDVRVDPGQFEQVLMNLCTNARDAMPEGGVLEIATANRHVSEQEADTRIGLRPGDYILLTVADTGPGISANDRAHVFEPFFTTKGEGEGTGLGLSTVYGIVKQSGGAIFLEEGPGARFSIFLPAVQDGR
jgi:PAS domain S-box-containing protein